MKTPEPLATDPKEIERIVLDRSKKLELKKQVEEMLLGLPIPGGTYEIVYELRGVRSPK